MPRRPTRRLATAAPPRIIRIVLRRPHHGAAPARGPSSRPHQVVALQVTDIMVTLQLRGRHHFAHIEHAEFRVFLGLLDHIPHLSDESLHLPLSIIKLIFELPIRPLQAIVLVLQRLFGLLLFLVIGTGC